MTESGAAGVPEREHFRVLPEPPRPETWVETVDAAEHPVITDEAERARLLRLAGGGAS